MHSDSSPAAAQRSSTSANLPINDGLDLDIEADVLRGLTPAQGAMLQLCGLVLLRGRLRRAANAQQCRKAIAEGRSMLRSLVTDADDGADVRDWHNRLIRQQVKGYRGGTAWALVKDSILASFDDPLRQAALDL